MPGTWVRVTGIMLVALAGTVGAQETSKTVYNARALNMGGGPTGAATRIQITVDRWTSDGQRRAMLNILKEEGHEAFIDGLHEMGQVGHARALGVAAGRANPFPSTPFQAAYQTMRGDQREIIMVAERPISASEARSNTESVNYNTTVIIMQFPANDGDAKGQGLLYRALKIRYDNDKDELQVEQMGREPVRLTEITKVD